MNFCIMVLSVLILFSSTISSQNILVDSSNFALLMNVGVTGGVTTGETSIAAGLIMGGVWDLVYQHGFVSVDNSSNSKSNLDYNAHSILLNLVLFNKKILLSTGISASTALINNVNQTLAGISFSLSNKFHLGQHIDLTMNISPGVSLNTKNFDDDVKFSFALNLNFLFGKHFYFGPAIGFANDDVFYGIGTGLILFFEDSEIE